MSLEAFIWTSQLPADVCGPKAFRVLLLLANHAHSDGRNVWRSNADMANQLHCSVRTIERAISELRMLGLIHEGDQKLTGHLRADRRPKVYDLNLMYGKAFDAPTTLVGAYDPTDLSRPDETGRNDPTTAVAHRTVIEPLTKTSQRNHTAAVGPSWHDSPRGTKCKGQLIDERHCEYGCIIPVPEEAMADA
ncbi:helix-turn-helix domain-containing protein [Leifsonia aquatica]|uniref:helix-turn-helix domain-containing protein n=1 Tax=Leifsonia aquatica TaxID=144185 RepID=UPI00381DEA1C